jgi:hypothetical protein
MYGNQLAKTGVGVTVFGFYVGQWWLVAIAVGLVIAGALAVRLTRPFRRDGGLR